MFLQYLVEELRETQIVMKEITEQILSGDFFMSGESYKELKEDYLAFMITMVDILNIYLIRSRIPITGIGKIAAHIPGR